MPLIQTPTPLHRLDRFSDELGIDLWIKRDDLTGFAMGGNKGRKLEYLLADALRQGADVLVSCGSLQSNFIRQLGAACSVHGLSCAAAAMAMPYEGTVGQPASAGLATSGGNVLLDEMLGVDLRVFPDGPWEELFDHAEALALQLEAAGRRVYRVPIGGSSALGAYAFHQAAEEVRAQAPPFDVVVCPTSSGSTQVGLAYAFRGTDTAIIGIACDPEPEMVEDLAELGVQLAVLLGVEAMAVADLRLELGYVGEGYGIPSPLGEAANLRLARAEGIFLDPVYTAKAFSGLIDLVERGELGGRVLFWHTGGLPALFAVPGSTSGS
jgi:D-cysteine desulfhydrase family pyridoxal phosphate-dependent enzyme